MSRRYGWGLAVWLLLACPHSGQAQHAPAAGQQPDERAQLRSIAAVLHRRVSMLATRVQRDLAMSRRLALGQRSQCLDPVLSDLHSTQRAVEHWASEVQRAPVVTPRLRGVLRVLREHLKELRGEAVECFGGHHGPEPGVTLLEVTITGDQPDDNPHSVPRIEARDVPWFRPR